MSACAHLHELVFIDRTPRSLGTIEGLSSKRMQGDTLFGAIARGMTVDWEGKIWRAKFAFAFGAARRSGI